METKPTTIPVAVDFEREQPSAIATDTPKDLANEMVYSLLSHAREDARLAEITASHRSYFHLADDCRNAVIALDKILATIVR